MQLRKQAWRGTGRRGRRFCEAKTQFYSQDIIATNRRCLCARLLHREQFHSPAESAHLHPEERLMSFDYERWKAEQFHTMEQEFPSWVIR